MPAHSPRSVRSGEFFMRAVLFPLPEGRLLCRNKRPPRAAGGPPPEIFYRAAIPVFAYYKKIRLAAITPMPRNTQNMDWWPLPYSCAVGRSSSKDIKTIMPAISANRPPRRAVLRR